MDQDETNTVRTMCIYTLIWAWQQLTFKDEFISRVGCQHKCNWLSEMLMECWVVLSYSVNFVQVKTQTTSLVEMW